jgi:hypothetical protein
MDIDKFGPPEIRGVDTDFDIYFRLNKSEADTISNPTTQTAIAAALTAGGPWGAIAAGLLSGYLGQIAANRGPHGCSVKLTVRNQVVLSEFIAQPI